MTKLFVICGHGAGDPGACRNGYQEAERVRVLGKRIKALGGSNVMLGDVNRDYYADNGISSLTISKDYQIVELHMDSAAPSARGAHVIIKAGLNADQYDMALAKFLSGMFPGRAQTIVGRADLANPVRAYAKGYSYRLIECGFISNAEDVSIFNNNLDKIAIGILACFGIGVQGTQPTDKPAASKPTAAKPKLDQILNKGDKFIIPGVYQVSQVSASRNAVICYALTGTPVAEYHWIDAAVCDEVTKDGKKSGNQILKPGEYVKINGTFTVLDNDPASDSVYAQIGKRKVWMYAKPLTEVNK